MYKNPIKSDLEIFGLPKPPVSAPPKTTAPKPKPIVQLKPLPKIDWGSAIATSPNQKFDTKANALLQQQVRASQAAAAVNAARLRAKRVLMKKQRAAAKDLGRRIRTITSEREAALQAERDKLAYKDLSPYERLKREAADKAFWSGRSQENGSGFWHTATGGFTSETAAREWAQAQLSALQNDVNEYEVRLAEHNRRAAKFNEAIKRAANSASQDDYNRVVTEAQKWIKSSLEDLNGRQAYIEGSAEGYEKFANSELNSPIGRLGQWMNPANNPISGGMKWLFDHTLGSGDENIPSLVTLPSRALNALGNWIDPNRQINKYDGTSQQGNQGKNPWQASFEQRNLNIGNSSNTFDRDHVIESDYQTALNLYRNRKKPQGDQAWYSGRLPSKEEWLNEEQYAYEGGRRIRSGSTREDVYYKGSGLESKKVEADVANNTLEFFADPLMLAGGPLKVASKAGKTAENLARLKKLAGEKVTGSSWIQKAADSKVGKGVKWLGSEQKSAKQRYFDESKKYTKHQLDLQDQYLPKIRALYEKLGKKSFNYSVLDDLAKISDEDAGILQRMTGLNVFDVRDQAKLFGSLDARKKREFLLSIQKRQQENARLMKEVDNVGSTRFDNRYWARAWSDPKRGTKYTFRGQRKNDVTQSAEELRASQIERYFQSAVDDASGSGAKLGAEVTAAQKELKSLWDEYKLATRAGGAEMDRLYKKMRGRGEKLRKVIGIPMSVWKASVLALRPAWYLNNKAYNVFAGLNSAGLSYIPESLSMLKKGSLRAAREANPQVVSKIGKYTDHGNPLYKPASALEDSDRLAAYQALIKQGSTPEEALKRVDKYFFNYSTKNYERPLKTLMPFWAWTKGTAGAAVRMPTDRPLSAKLINENEENNQRELSKIPEDSRKYYEGRQFLGYDGDGNPIFANNPFNPFSSKNFSNVSANPFIAALSELSTQKDYYGNPLEEKDVVQAFLNKFPQVPLAKQTLDVWRKNKGDLNAVVKYFSNIGSEGYAMTKRRTGNDPNDPSYSSKLDVEDKFKENWLAYFGMPRTGKFDWARYKRQTALTELNQQYFNTDWEREYPDYTERVAAQEKLAKDAGFDLQKDLYKGLWSKNDTELTTDLKSQKEAARQYLSDFWNEYHALPQDGNRNVWVKDKMREIVDSGVLKENAFIADGLPDWYDPTARERATAKQFWNRYFAADKTTRQKLMRDNPQYNKFSAGTSQKSLDYRSAKKSGDWVEYTRKYGDTRQGDPAKRAFWDEYFKSDSNARKELLAAHPEYDKFKDDEPKTQAEWDEILEKVKVARKKRAMGNADFVKFFNARKKQALADRAAAARRDARTNRAVKWLR